MPIWFGDWLHRRKPLEPDHLVLYWNDDTVMAAHVIEGPYTDNVHIGRFYPWIGEVPPEHPDDVAFDAQFRE